MSGEHSKPRQLTEVPIYTGGFRLESITFDMDSEHLFCRGQCGGVDYFVRTNAASLRDFRIFQEECLSQERAWPELDDDGRDPAKQWAELVRAAITAGGVRE